MRVPDDQERQVPEIVIAAVEAIQKVPAYRAKVTATITTVEIIPQAGEQKEKTYAYDVLYDPQTGISTEVLTAPADAIPQQTPEARVSIDIPGFLESVRSIWKEYQTKDDVVNGRRLVKITGSLGDTGVTGAVWIDPETLCVARVEASGPADQKPSLKILAEYDKWADTFVLREATIESGGERVVLQYTDYEILRVPERQ